MKIKNKKKLDAAIHLHIFKVLSDIAMNHYRMHADLAGQLKGVKRKKNGEIVIDMKKLKKRKVRK